MTLNLRLLLCLSVVLPFQGNAHAILTSSNPASKQSVKGPDVEIQLTFNSRIDVKRSRLMVVAPDRTQSAVTIGSQSSPQKVTAKAIGLKHGSYVLRWQVLANDGHITRGEIPFDVE